MILADFGTSYCKVLDLEIPSATPSVLASKDLAPDMQATVATGHNGKRYCAHHINELIALARGGKALIQEPDFVLLDCGSRDIKFVKYKDGQMEDMGWNSECGASMGFTIELLARYYDIDYHTLPVPDRPFSVTCGVLGMSKIFDAVVSGVSEADAVARFVKGIAVNAFRFASSPPKVYLSGGLCDNPVFVKSLPCEVVPLGRFVLLEGLKVTAKILADRGLLE